MLGECSHPGEPLGVGLDQQGGGCRVRRLPRQHQERGDALLHRQEDLYVTNQHLAGRRQLAQPGDGVPFCQSHWLVVSADGNVEDSGHQRTLGADVLVAELGRDPGLGCHRLNGVIAKALLRAAAGLP